MKTAEQAQMEDAMLAREVTGAYPAPDTAPESLHRRVAALAARHGQKAERQRARRRILRAAGGVLSAAAAAARVVFVGPAVSGAFALGRIAGAVEDARSVALGLAARNAGPRRG